MIHFTASFADRQYILNTEMGLKSKITAHTAEEFAGRVWTTEPIVTGAGEQYSIDVTFSSPIISASFVLLGLYRER